MKVLDPGHHYELDNFEDSGKQELKFIKKTPKGGLSEDQNDLITQYDGTTNEEVLKVVIDRLETLYKILPDNYTKRAITHLKRCLKTLETRAIVRKNKGVEGTHKAA